MTTTKEHGNGPGGARNDEARWAGLYRVGGAAAILTAVLMPLQVIAFVMQPFPTTVAGWFDLFEAHRILAFADLDVLLVADTVLLAVVFLALGLALWRRSESAMLIAIVLGVVGTVLSIAANPAFEMASLSARYAAATTEVQRQAMLAAGEALMAAWQGTAFKVGYLLESIAGIALSVVMLRGRVFSKAAAWLGLLAFVVGLGIYVPSVGTFIALGSVIFLEVWYPLIGIRLWRLAAEAASSGVP